MLNPNPLPNPQDLPELVHVRIGGGRFAFYAEVVQEVLQMVEATPVPGWPRQMVGLIDLRGVLIPMVDVAPTLGMRPLDLAPHRFVLVVRALDKPWAVVVDGVDRVRAETVHPRTTLAPSEVVGTGEVVAGVAHTDEGPLVVFDTVALIRGSGAARYVVGEVPR